MRVTTQLYRDPTKLMMELMPSALSPGSVLVLFSLDLDPEALVPVARQASRGVTVYLADCYGILGYSVRERRNLELMEAGRGQEYGGPGGDGGQGVVAAAFEGDAIETVVDTLPAGGDKAHMVISTHGSGIVSWLADNAVAPYYGGLAKQVYRFDPESGEFKPHRWLAVSHPASGVGLTSFTEHPADAVRDLLGQASGQPMQAVALFPCFMRGKNVYGENDVEPRIVSELLPDVRVFGMFCHGELGPMRCLGFGATADTRRTCTQHSMTTIVAAYPAHAD